MAGIRGNNRKSKLGKKEKAALRRLERSRVRQARTETRVTELRERLALAEAKLTRRAARLAEAEADVKSATAPKKPKKDTVRARKGSAQGGKAATGKSAAQEREVVAGATTPQETIAALAALSEVPSAPVVDGAVTPERAADAVAVTAQERRNGARPARSRSRSHRKAASGES